MAKIEPQKTIRLDEEQFCVDCVTRLRGTGEIPARVAANAATPFSNFELGTLHDPRNPPREKPVGKPDTDVITEHQLGSVSLARGLVKTVMTVCMLIHSQIHSFG